MNHSLLAILVIFVVAITSVDACHNSTGACHHQGYYICLDGSHVAWNKRCDGVEDCADGMDEFMCPAKDSHDGDNQMHAQASCGPSCHCLASTTLVTPSSPYWQFSIHAPVWDALMSAPNRLPDGGFGCNPDVAKTSGITMKWYRKGFEKNGVCEGNPKRRGYVCCGRQVKCICTSVTTARCT